MSNPLLGLIAGGLGGLVIGGIIHGWSFTG
jgi:hypothetical protein